MFPLFFFIVVEISLDIDLHYSMLYNLFSNTGFHIHEYVRIGGLLEDALRWLLQEVSNHVHYLSNLLPLHV